MVEIFNEFGQVGAPSIYLVSLEWFDEKNDEEK
jgi:hypothetical protein